jgi:hypothetical protein
VGAATGDQMELDGTEMLPVPHFFGRQRQGATVNLLPLGTCSVLRDSGAIFVLLPRTTLSQHGQEHQGVGAGLSGKWLAGRVGKGGRHICFVLVPG